MNDVPGSATLGRLGALLIGVTRYTGSVLLVLFGVFKAIFSGRLKRRDFLQECVAIGVGSFLTVSLVSFFMGMVLAMQAATPLRLTGSEFYVATLVAMTAIREMGPLLTAFLLCGRVGSAIAAEIGTMKITDQVDALKTLAVDPAEYLVAPKFLAACLMLPALTVFSTAFQIFGGYLVGVGTLNLTTGLYVFHSFRFVVLKDVMIGLLKALVFGVVIVIIASREGLSATGGARGVGAAATTAVVVSLFLIILADFVITAIFYFI